MSDGNKITNDEFNGIILSARKQAMLSAMMVAGDNRSKALLSILASVYGSMSAAAMVASCEEATDAEMVNIASPAVNAATLTFSALMILKCFKPNEEGAWCNYGPHTIKAALEACEKLFGIKPDQYLNEGMVQAARTYKDSDLPKEALDMMHGSRATLN